MSDANKAATRQFFKALGSGDVATLKNLVTDDVEAITPGTADISGTRNYEIVMQLAKAFPLITQSGIEFRILNLTAEDDRVACEMEGYSTLRNGKPYNNCYHFPVFFRDGKICRLKEYLDTKLGDAVLGPYILK
ncbi:MAG: nuclear transport factor 2 family protein [Steroidobacteraceae bacterium]